MVFHESYYDAIKLLPDEKRLEAYDALMRYEFEGDDPEELSYEVELIFTILKPLLDAAAKKREDGKKGGRPKKETDGKEKKNHRFLEEETIGFEKQKASEVKESKVKGSKVKGSEVKDEARAREARPTLEEIRSYCEERGNTVDPEMFFDFYEAKGWKVGNAPMRNWKAAVRTWEKRREYPSRSSPKANNGLETHDADLDDLERRLLG